MRKVAVLVVLAVLVAAAGCTGPFAPTDNDDQNQEPELLSVESVYYGWATVYVAFDHGWIHWGDSFDRSESYTQITAPGLVTHYYSEIGVYGVRLLDDEAPIADVPIVVGDARGYAELVGVDGLGVTVRQHGAKDVMYHIEWGDGTATAMTPNDIEEITLYDTGDPTLRRHRYAGPGTYTVSVRQPTHDNAITCFTVEVDSL